jgi:hypothetical protein
MGNGFLDDLPELDLPAKQKTGTAGKPVPTRKTEELYPTVIYSRVNCPFCKSEKTRVYDSSHLPIRYHKCLKCKNTFKSIEK